MNLEFRKAVDSLHPKFEQLIAASPYTKGAVLPKQGVYLFCKNGKALYVGRSNNIRRRYGQHTQLGASPNQAAFAMLIARKKARTPVDYSKGARERLLTNRKFMDEFRKAKKLIRKMEFLAVKECDQTRQALLEIYCSIALKTPYNDFIPH